MLEKVQLFILARDRLDYLKETLTSATRQTQNSINLEIIVSDNSDTDNVKNFMDQHYRSIKYIRRSPPSTVWQHFRAVIEEATSEYIVIFHDDDILLPDFCERMVEKLRNNKHVAAIGCNAIKIDTYGREIGTFHSRKNDVLIDDEKWFLRQYVPTTKEEKGIAPFPSYCYRLAALNADDVGERDGGACADATFVSKILRFGKIIWLAEPLIKYRIHSGSGSARIHIDDYRKLWRYMVSIGIDKRDLEFSSWRYGTWFHWHLKTTETIFGLLTPNSWRSATIQRIFLKKFLKRPGRTFLKLLFGYWLYVMFNKKNCRV